MSSKKQDGLQQAKRISEILTPSSSSKDPLVQEKLSQLRELVGPDPLDDELIEALRQNTNDVHGAFETLQQTSKDSWSTQTRSRKKPTGPSTTAPSTRGNHANRTSSGSRGRGQRTRGGSESRGGSEARSGSHGRGHSRSAEVRSTHVPAPAAVHPQPLDGTAETAVSTPVPAPASAPPSNPKAHVTVEVHHKAPQSNSTKKTYASVTGQTQNNRAPSNQRGGPRGPSARGGSAAGGSHHRGPHREHHPEAVQPPAPKPWLNAALKSVAVKTPVAQHPPVDAPKQPEPIPEELTHVEPEPEPVPQTLPSQVHIEASIGTPLPVESAPYVIDTHTSSPPAPEPIAAPQQPPAQFDIPLFTSGDAFQENPKIRFGSFHSNSPHESATVTSTHDSQADHAQNSNLVNTQQSLQSQQTFSQSQAPQPTASSPPPQSQPRSQSGQHVDDKLSGRHPSHTGVMHLPPDFHHGQQPFHPHYLPPAFPPMFTQYEHAAELMGLPPAHLAAAPGSLTHPESAKTGQAGLRMPSPTGGSPTAPAEAAAPGSQPYHPSPYPNTPIGGLPLYYGAPYVPYPYQPSQFNPPYPRAPSAAYFKPPYPGNYPPSGTHSYPSEDMIHPTDYMYSPPGYYMGDTRQSSQSVSQTKPGDGSNDISQAQGPPPTSQGQSPMRYDPPYYPPWPSYPNA